MTLDDHEIADQFARDFTPAGEDCTRAPIVEEATVAYRDYVHARNPAPDEARARREPRQLLVPFRRWRRQILRAGHAHAALRPWRAAADDRREQMEALLEWMMRLQARSEVRRDQRAVRGRDQRRTASRLVDDVVRTGSRAGVDGAPGPAPQSRQRQVERDAVPAAARPDHRAHRRDTGSSSSCFSPATCTAAITRRCASVEGSKYESHRPSTSWRRTGQPAAAGERGGVRPSLHRRPDVRQHVAYEVLLERFHGEVSAVMHVKVEYIGRDEVTGTGRVVPEVEWNVIRTLTDDGASAGARYSSRPRPQQVPAEHPRQTGSGERSMAGRISFVGSGGADELDAGAGCPARR